MRPRFEQGFDEKKISGDDYFSDGRGEEQGLNGSKPLRPDGQGARLEN
jgi:hypothetical protein